VVDSRAERGYNWEEFVKLTMWRRPRIGVVVRAPVSLKAPRGVNGEEVRNTLEYFSQLSCVCLNIFKKMKGEKKDEMAYFPGFGVNRDPAADGGGG
jgi:hypothetical protein